MYRSHDDDTLRYMSLALYRMNQYKEVFRPYRPLNPKGDTDGEDIQGHFNFPKVHAMVHYTEMIKLLGPAPDLETGHFEHKHVIYVKSPYKLTNKKLGWEDQIMEHNRRKMNMLAVFDTGFGLRPLTIAEKREQAEQSIRPTSAVDIPRFFDWLRTATKRSSRAKTTWITVAEVEEELGAPLGTHFRQAMAVFVRESRGFRSPPSNQRPAQQPRDPDLLERDDSWVKGFRVQFHASIRCWKRTGQDPDDAEAAEQDIVRCAPDWQGIKGNGRYDWIWVQEYRTGSTDHGLLDETSPPLAFDGRLPARMRFIVSVQDEPESGSGPVVDPRDGTAGMPIQGINDPDTPSVYTGVFVDLYRPKSSDGLAGAIHGMTVITPLRSAPWKGILQGRRIYPLASVYHSIHVVPVNDHHAKGDMYINNTADFETYNFLWNCTWETDEAAQACRAREERIKTTRSKLEQRRKRQLLSSNDSRQTKTKRLLSIQIP
nr:hypothetical protein CFP56_64735 [Quercus suber]